MSYGSSIHLIGEGLANLLDGQQSVVNGRLKIVERCESKSPAMSAILYMQSGVTSKSRDRPLVKRLEPIQAMAKGQITSDPQLSSPVAGEESLGVHANRLVWHHHAHTPQSPKDQDILVLCNNIVSTCSESSSAKLVVSRVVDRGRHGSRG